MGLILDMSIAGREVRARGLRLYPGPEVAEWRATLAQAQQELGGTSSGIGLIGSPGWVIGGAMVLGALENALSSAKAKEGVRTLGRANEALKALRDNGKVFEIEQLRNLATPNPSAWVGDGDGYTMIDLNKVAFLDRGGIIKAHGKTKADVIGGKLRVASDVLYVGLDEDFHRFQLEDGSPLNVRWSSVDSFQIAES